MRIPALFALLALGAAAPAGAQPQLRTLSVPASSAWQHAQTQLILPAKIGTLQRASIRDVGTEELNVVAAYSGSGEGITATIYLYKTMLPSVPVWFDRSATVMQTLRGGAAASLAAQAFAAPGSQVANGLRAVGVGAGRSRSEALAVMPLENWLVKVRMSSTALEPEQLRARLSALIEGIRWPTPAATAKPPLAASPVQPCPTPHKTKRARTVRPDMESNLLGGLFAMVASTGPIERSFCRDSEAGLNYAVYRPLSSFDSYVVALADAGLAISVAPAAKLENLTSKSNGRSARYAITVLDRTGAGLGPQVNRLPPPEQAIALATRRGSGIRMSVGSKP